MKGWVLNVTWKLFKTLVNHSIQELLINRQTAIITFVLGVLFFALEIVAGIIFFEYTDNLLGWTRQDYLLLVSVASTVSFLYQTFFAVSHENLTDVVLEGELDHAILRPIDAFWYYAFYRIDISSALNLGVSCLALVYLLGTYTLTVGQSVLFIISLFLAAYFLFLLNQWVVSLAFWHDNASSVTGLPEYLVEFSLRPLVVYPTAIRFVLTWCVPILIGINLPVLVVRGESNFIIIIFLSIVNVIGTWLARYIWKKGLSHYSSSN